jgi:uncharacterized membrane protein
VECKAEEAVEVRDFRRDMAFLTTIRARQRAGQSLAGIVSCAQELGDRRRVQSWADEDFHSKRPGLTDAAYYNLLTAAISTLPVLVTGILAWQYQLEGQKLKGILLLHLILACVSSVMIWLVWWVNFRARRRAQALPSYRLAIEFLAVGIVALTGHLGGFLSGVNG